MLNLVLEKIEKLGKDVIVESNIDNDTIEIMVNDNETNEEVIEELENWLKANCNEYEKCFHQYYYFNTCTVQIIYQSFYE